MPHLSHLTFEGWYQDILRINLDYGMPLGPGACDGAVGAEEWEVYFDRGYLPEQAFDVALRVLDETAD